MEERNEKRGGERQREREDRLGRGKYEIINKSEQMEPQRAGRMKR
jgi:hypothetical protein